MVGSLFFVFFAVNLTKFLGFIYFRQAKLKAMRQQLVLIFREIQRSFQIALFLRIFNWFGLIFIKSLRAILELGLF